jgi:hypothetical protein
MTGTYAVGSGGGKGGRTVSPGSTAQHGVAQGAEFEGTPSTTGKDPSRDLATSEQRRHACCIDICIESKGDVNIYNCTAPPPKDEQAGGENPCPPPVEGACLPVGLGAKPKQSRERKLDTLLGNTRVPSALAGSFFHTARRFNAGQTAANPLEESAFNLMRSLPPELKGLLSCAVGSFDSIPKGQRDRLFVSFDPNLPIDAESLGTVFAKELVQRVGDQVFGNPNAVEEERPGRNRFFDPGSEESFFIQLRICRINGLRTSNIFPPIPPGDYLPTELQQHCEPVQVGNEVQLNCEVLKGDCPGNFLADGTCLRVPDVENGQAVVLEGVNFISVDAKVRLTAQAPGTVTRDVDSHVFGDLDTPLTEIVDGETRTINDCRVHDRLTFRVPDDLPPGIYSVQIVMPNVTGIPGLGDPILSNTEFIQVLPPSNARFQIASERLIAHRETAPARFGSDEVRVRVSAFPISATLTELILGDEQRFDSPKFGDVDSGDERDLTAVLFSHQQPISGVVMTILGHEIDSDKAYEQQIDSFGEAFVDYMKIALAALVTGLIAGGFAIGIKDLLKLGLKHPIILAVAAAIALAVILFLSAWAPADLIIQDELGFTTVDLAALTNGNFPPPLVAELTTSGGIKVKVTPLEKGPSEYRERREYVSEDEESRYEITLRYNRVA